MDEKEHERFGAHERAIGVHDARLDAHGVQIDDMRECIAKLTVIVEQQQRTAEVMERRIAALEAQPAKGWERIKASVLTGAVSLVVGVVVTLVTTGIVGN